MGGFLSEFADAVADRIDGAVVLILNLAQQSEVGRLRLGIFSASESHSISLGGRNFASQEAVELLANSIRIVVVHVTHHILLSKGELGIEVQRSCRAGGQLDSIPRGGIIERLLEAEGRE
jgi:hypothetical protein